MNRIIEYTPPPLVDKFITSGIPLHNNVSVIVGPLGSGKTTGSIFKIIYHALRQQPSPKDGIRYSKWVVIRNTKQQLRDTTLQSFFEWFPKEENEFGIWRESDMTYQLRMGDIRCDIIFRALDEEADIRRILSLNVTGIYINELRELERTLFINIRARAGRYPNTPDLGKPSWWGTIADSNSYDEDHWMFDVFDMNCPIGWTFINQPSGLSKEAENIDHLSPNYYRDLMFGATKEWINVHIRNLRGSDKTGKPVYGESFDKPTHVSREPLTPSSALPLMIGLDIGRTPAAVLMQQHMNGQVRVLEEVLGTNIGLNVFLERDLKPVLNARYATLPVIVAPDPAAYQQSQLIDLPQNSYMQANPGTPALFQTGQMPGLPQGLTGIHVLRSANFNIVPRYILTNDISLRISAVEAHLSRMVKGQPGYIIDGARCPKLVKGFNTSYKYKKKKDGSFENKPLKDDYSHVHDANQYGCLAIGKIGLEHFGYMNGTNVAEVKQVSLGAWG